MFQRLSNKLSSLCLRNYKTFENKAGQQTCGAKSDKYVKRSVKTRRMSQNAKLSFWSHFKAKSELFPELFKFLSR